MKKRTLVAVLVAILAMLTLVSMAAAKKPGVWDPTHLAVFTGDLSNTAYLAEDQKVMDDSKYIRSDMMVNDFELDYGAAFTGCPTPPAGVAGYLSILKPVGKREMELRHNWLVEVGGVTHLTSLFCAGGSFVIVGDGYDIDHDGDCTVTDRYAGEEYQYTCNVSFHIDVDPF